MSEARRAQPSLTINGKNVTTKLAEYLENSIRFFGCQIVMATHSPFLLSMREARIYDLDERPADVKRWTRLPNMRTYYEFFRKHQTEFDLE